MQKNIPSCAKCPFKPTERTCRKENGKHPQGCPTVFQRELSDAALAKYQKEETFEFARQASIQEKHGYCNIDAGYSNVRPAKPRLEEIFDFIHRMKYQKVGLAFCIGLQREAAAVDTLFTARNINLVSAVCKAGRIDKGQLDLKDDDKISAGQFESMCNPILQAELLNKAGTEFNVVLGLCVGHDSLFFMHSKAPATVLAVKDRVTGHNPLAPLYTIDSYYRGLKK